MGKDEQKSGESIENYWDRLQSLMFRLTILRGIGMPEAERYLWKQLWTSCAVKIEHVLLQIRDKALAMAPVRDSAAIARPPSAAERNTATESEDLRFRVAELFCEDEFPHAVQREAFSADEPDAQRNTNDGSTYRQSAAVKEVVVEAVKSAALRRGELFQGLPPDYLDGLLAEFRERAIRELTQCEAASTLPSAIGQASSPLKANVTKAPLTVPEDLSRCRFAQPIARKTRESALERRFAQLGLRAMENGITRYRPASGAPTSKSTVARENGGKPTSGECASTKSSRPQSTSSRVPGPSGYPAIRQRGHAAPISAPGSEGEPPPIEHCMVTAKVTVMPPTKSGGASHAPANADEGYDGSLSFSASEPPEYGDDV